MMRGFRSSILGLLALAAVGCKEQLVVENTNNPDRTRALARPTDVENLAAGQYRVIHNAWWQTTNLQAQVAVLGMESFSSNANFGMGPRAAVPRSLIDNSRGNPADFYAGFLNLARAARAEALALSALQDPNFTFFPRDTTRTNQARAFAFFIKGLAMGYMAMTFDSGPVILPTDDPLVINPLVGYPALMAAALVDFDSAVAIATRTSGMSIPGNTAFWIQGGATLTGGAGGTFIQLVRSFRARLRAGVARTPAERAAVDWVAVRADAAAGITANYSATMTNITDGWFYRPMQMDLYQSWHQMWQGILGMAADSVSYTNWLNLSRSLKVPFTIVTPDIRFPAGGTRGAQQTASGCVTSGCLQPAATAPFPYLRNRLGGEDVAVDPLFHSQYDFYRFQAHYNSNRNGTVIIFPRAELDLLMAEADIRSGAFASAEVLINNTRTARGLPALAGTASLATLVPGGTACVPRVPVGPTDPVTASPTATACGNIMEAMKWEKRLETAYIYPGGWYFEGRGWGDLPFNTPIQFPVPYTELDSRRQPIYSQPTSGAGAVTYTAAERLSNSASNYGYGN